MLTGENTFTDRQLRQFAGSIRPADRKWFDACMQRWDSLCKPLRGFGHFEELVATLCMIREDLHPSIDKRAVLILGADNGVVCEGISQTGSEVTWQVLDNMGYAKSSVCVMSQKLGADVFPVNIGMLRDAVHPKVRNISVRRGTGNIRKESAMTRSQCLQAVGTGISLIKELKARGYELIIPGEMGIGNTTTSAACASVLFDADPAVMAGRGAGLSTKGLDRKVRVIREAIALNRPDRNDPVDIIAKVGGLDIAGLTGCFLGAAACRVPVLVDGVITGLAACMAAALSPAAADFMIVTHATTEPAQSWIEDRLQKQPVLHGGMHLGEGTGAAMFLPMLDMAVHVYETLPTFEGGSVERYQHLK